MISVAIGTYNGEKYIKEQLDSLLNQTIAVDEIVVCDDCSKDNTLSIVNNAINANSTKTQISVFSNESNMGFVKNFEKAISLTKGEYIFLCDQDDLWLPNKVERTMEEFANYPYCEMVFSDLQMFSESNDNLGKMFDVVKLTDNKIKKINSKKATKIILKRHYVTGAASCIKRSLFERVMPFWIGGMYHDAQLAIIAAITEKLRVVKDVLTLYRRHQQQVTKDANYKSRKIALKQRLAENENRAENERQTKWLVDFAEKKQFNKNQKKIISKRYKHAFHRANLSKNIIKKFFYSTAELLNLNYFNFSSGFKSYFLDLLRK